MGTLTTRRGAVDEEMPRGKKPRPSQVDEGPAQGRGTQVTLAIMRQQQEGAGMTAHGQSDANMRTKAALANKLPKFFSWVQSLQENHQYNVVKTLIPADDHYTSMSPAQMTDRRYVSDFFVLYLFCCVWELEGVWNVCN